MSLTWHTLKIRQRNERIALLTAERDNGHTQTVAAQRLGMSPRALNNVLRREGIPWPHVRQGQRKEATQ